MRCRSGNGSVVQTLELADFEVVQRCRRLVSFKLFRLFGKRFQIDITAEGIDFVDFGRHGLDDGGLLPDIECLQVDGFIARIGGFSFRFYLGDPFQVKLGKILQVRSRAVCRGSVGGGCQVLEDQLRGKLFEPGGS